MRAGGARLRHEACRRIDAAARADRDEQVAGDQRLVDAVHLARHLAEPHHVGPQGARLAASRADRLGGQVLGPGIARQTCGAERAGKLTMHMDQRMRAGRLVQAVDVLRHGEDARLRAPSPAAPARDGRRSAWHRQAAAGGDCRIRARGPDCGRSPRASPPLPDRTPPTVRLCRGTCRARSRPKAPRRQNDDAAKSH